MIPKLVNLKVGWELKQRNGQISIDISSSNQIQFIIFRKILLACTNSDSTHINTAEFLYNGYSMF